jgi:hypothetical protein
VILTLLPSVEPTEEPTSDPTFEPSLIPTIEPSIQPTIDPSRKPTVSPSFKPSLTPSFVSTSVPSTEMPTIKTNENSNTFFGAIDINTALSIIVLLALILLVCCFYVLLAYCRKPPESDLVEGHAEMTNWIRDNYEGDVLTAEVITNRASIRRRLGNSRFSEENPLHDQDLDLPIAKPIVLNLTETTI